MDTPDQTLFWRIPRGTRLLADSPEHGLGGEAYARARAAQQAAEEARAWEEQIAPEANVDERERNPEPDSGPAPGAR